MDRMKDLTALILCAGLGTRLRPLTYFVPKPLIKVGGKAVIDYILDYLSGFGISKIFINLHHLGGQIAKHVGGKALYSWEPKLLGTGGAIGPFLPYLSDPFLVLNGDTITNLDLGNMMKLQFRIGRPMTIFTQDTAVHNGGVFLISKGLAVDFLTRFSPPFSLHEDVIPNLESQKMGLLKDGGAEYYDIGTPKKLAKTRGLFANKN